MEEVIRASKVRHKINTADRAPIRKTTKRLALAKRVESEKIICETKKDGVIEPWSSSWTSPVMLARKKGTIFVDYREFNNVTKKNHYLLSRIDDTLDTLVGSKIFPSFDLKSGY